MRLRSLANLNWIHKIQNGGSASICKKNPPAKGLKIGRKFKIVAIGVMLLTWLTHQKQKLSWKDLNKAWFFHSWVPIFDLVFSGFDSFADPHRTTQEMSFWLCPLWHWYNLPCWGTLFSSLPISFYDFLQSILTKSCDNVYKIFAYLILRDRKAKSIFNKCSDFRWIMYTWH